LKERRETFEEAFKEDLEEYKATGSISSMYSSFKIFFIFFENNKKILIKLICI